MEHRTLRYFLTIAREENMTNAANILHVSQSALSRQMADLEAELGRKLFIRTNRKTMLSEDGMRLRQRAEEIISLVEKTEMEFKASDETISGQIAIGAGETRTFSLIARAMKQTQSRFPHIHFTVYSANAVDVTERLEHGTLDFGLLFEPVNKEHYQYLAMPCADTVGLLVHKKDPLADRKFITQEDLISVPLIVSSRISPDTLLGILSPRIVEKLTIAATYNLIYNASLMVEQRLGAALAIEHLVQITPKSPYIFIPLSPTISMHTVFAWKKYQILTKPEELFLKQLYSLLPIIKAGEPENNSQPESPHPRQ